MEVSLSTKNALASNISSWIKDYAINGKIESLIVGVSGGIDSALVSTLCAMTGMRTIVLSMPIYQHSSHEKRANNHIAWLKANYSNVESYNIDLSESFQVLDEQIFSCLRILPWDEKSKLASANTRSRLRMIALYQAATLFNGIVVGTGNKIEDFGVGFFTKYGDGGVDISPIADLTKTQVKKLAQELGVIEDIILAKPSDGLWEDDKSDEDQIGASYEELEWAMNYIDEVRGPSKSLDSTLSLRQREVIKIYENMHRKNYHKMIPIPMFKLNSVYND